MGLLTRIFGNRDDSGSDRAPSKLASSCPVVVNGIMDGEIDAPLLNIASSGVMPGVVRANTLHSLGTLSGHIDAGDVFLAGVVRSQTLIKARRLEVRMKSPGNGHLEVTFGACDLEPIDIGSEPEPEAS